MPNIIAITINAINLTKLFIVFTPPLVGMTKGIEQNYYTMTYTNNQ